MIRYLLRRVVRNKKKAGLQIVFISVISFLLLLFEHSIAVKEEKKETAYENIPVYAYIEPKQNMLKDIEIPFSIIDEIESTGFTKQTYLEMKVPLYIIEPINFVTREGDIANTFYGISDINSFDPVKGGYLEVVWAEGIDYSNFNKAGQVCILPESVFLSFQDSNLTLGDEFYVAGGLRITDNYDFLENQVWFPLKIAGYYKEKEVSEGRKYEFLAGDLIVPLHVIKENLYELGFNFTNDFIKTKYEHYNCAEFLLTNTKHLDEFKEQLKTTDFMLPYEEIKDKRIAEFSFVISDSLLNQTVQPIQSSIRFMLYLKPALFALGALIGFFLSILGMGQAKKEYAIMRSLGTKKGSIFFIFLAENLVLCGISIAITLLLRSIGGFVQTTKVSELLLFSIFYILGSMTELFLLNRVEPLKILAVKE